MQKTDERLFVVYKPPFVSSNRYLGKIKRKYRVKKAGFSGTLDPFAKGVLIVAFGKYTKLFRFLKKTPKRYRATLWLGAKSDTLDIEKIEKIDSLKPFDDLKIKTVLKSFLKEIKYLPPKYCAKKIKGKKAYELARSNEIVELKEIASTIYDIKLLHYTHPFLTFEISISEGGYIRSIGLLIAQKLGCNGALSALERLSEGEFVYEGEKELDPLFYLDLKENFYLKEQNDILLGKKVSVKDFTIKDEGEYLIKLDKMFSIIQIKDDRVKYLLNGVNYANTFKKSG